MKLITNTKSQKMKQTALASIIIASLFVLPVKAQETNYLNISVDAGMVANTERDNNTGMGGSIGYFLQDNFLLENPLNYLSLNIKAFNNPYEGGKLVSSIMNDVDDAFNYIMPLVGYRFTQQGMIDGFFIEPRIGAVIGASYTGFAFSPVVGYAIQKFNLSLFCDMGFGKNNSAIRKKNFLTPGLSISYNININ